jgi:hypothetical protein
VLCIGRTGLNLLDCWSVYYARGVSAIQQAAAEAGAAANIVAAYVVCCAVQFLCAPRR